MVRLTLRGICADRELYFNEADSYQLDGLPRESCAQLLLSASPP